MTDKKAQYIDSEHYRQMLVKDGDRRFQEWHTRFLDYQKQFRKETASSHSPRPSTYSSVQSSSE